MKTICVYAASSDRVPLVFKEEARKLGELLGARGHSLVYGAGGIGLMGIVARAAKERGARVVGVIPEKLRDVELAWKGADELIVTTSMHERKSQMEALADAFIVFPGGFGTLDEAAEVLVLRQLQYHHKPIVFLNVQGIFDPLLAYFDSLRDLGFAHEDLRGIYTVATTAEDALDYIESYDPPEPNPDWFVSYKSE